MKNKKNIINIIKASRKINRETEIREHGKALKIYKIKESKKIYSRKRNKDVNNPD